MNFLAHLLLSGNDPEIMVGNFIGDFVKGKNALKSFKPSIIKGIELHRSIDHFTDTHQLVAKSKNRLKPKYRHYAGVIVDVFYDHCLAMHWQNYHHNTLNNFAAHAYATIRNADEILPEPVKQLLPYMVSGNWLVSYATLTGIQRALTGMARRTPYESKMEEAVADLELHYDAFNEEFANFFPEAIKMVNDALANKQ